MKKKQDKDSYPENNSTFLSIKDWREDERPRERLITRGPSSLSDAELLAILIGSGTRSFSALDAGRELLDKYKDLTNLSSCDLSEIRQVKGLGNAKAVRLAAAFEISKRIQAEPFSSKKSIRSPEDIAALFIPRLRGSRSEKFFVLLLNTSNQVYREVQVSEGILNSSIVHPREVFRLAITESAASVIIMHNHPSGNPEPSKEDLAITKKLADAGKLIDIKVLDHLIIAGDTFFSFAKKGLI